MSENKIEISIKDIPEIIETLKEVEKEIDFERKSKNLFIDDLYKVCEMSLKQQQEIERLNNIIKEVREYIEIIVKNTPSSTRKDYANMLLIDYKKLLEILDKENVKAIPPEVIGTNGEDGGLFDYGDKGE